MINVHFVVAVVKEQVAVRNLLAKYIFGNDKALNVNGAALKSVRKDNAAMLTDIPVGNVRGSLWYLYIVYKNPRYTVFVYVERVYLFPGSTS